MRFRLIDRITEIQSGERIVASKELRADEDYLRDHFPHFPVMPGVLMLEAMFQASMWLVRYTDGFRTAVVLLKEARNVKYADFVQPGHVLRISAQMAKHDAVSSTLKVEGHVNDSLAVSGRLVLERFNQHDRGLGDAITDAITRKLMRDQFRQLAGGLAN
ncbi:MAG: 3-hydroxyacyl-ACP dehydratase FabZ family protein [Pirellulaceae bacterium]